MKQRPLDLNLNDPEMRAARARLIEEEEAKQEAEAHFSQRMKEASEAIAPNQAIAYMFVPGKNGRFEVIAIPANTVNKPEKL
jgi:hypothetical protein